MRCTLCHLKCNAFGCTLCITDFVCELDCVSTECSARMSLVHTFTILSTLTHYDTLIISKLCLLFLLPFSLSTDSISLVLRCIYGYSAVACSMQQHLPATEPKGVYSRDCRQICMFREWQPRADCLMLLMVESLAYGVALRMKIASGLGCCSLP